MRRCLLLTHNPALGSNLRHWLTEKEFANENQVAVRTVGSPPDSRNTSREFHALADWLEEELANGLNHQDLPEVVVLTDLAGYGELDPMVMNPVMNHGWATVLGMLVLAFPEIHWVLAAGTIAEEKQAALESLDKTRGWCDLRLGQTLERLSEVLGIVRSGFSPLFDPSGMRKSVILALANNPSEKERVVLPRRTELAAAVDEETSYAFLHAYTAYRFGFRSHVITTLAGMEAFLCGQAPHPYLVFEDIFLQFADGHPNRFSYLRERDEKFPHLKAKYRIFVTSGHHHGQDESACEDNPSYLEELRDSAQWNCELQKPLGGMFKLWQESKLQVKLREGGRHGLAPGYEGPLSGDATNEGGEGGHSAPGRLLAVADRLISRARRLLEDEVSSVLEAVYGAVLATDALELLGGKTPTTSLEALALRHRFEVLAECHFVGMQEHIDVRDRIADVERDVKAIGHWFGKNRRERQLACWNAELTILDLIIDIFQENNQFDEEQIVQATARRLHRKLWFQKRPLLKLFEFAPWYVEKLVASFPLFILALFAWIGLLGLAFCWAGLNFHQGFADSFSTFLSIQPPGDTKWWGTESGWNGPFCLIAFTMAMGFVHLGIFISHLYTLVSRK